MEGVYVKKNKCELTQTVDVASRYLHEFIKRNEINKEQVFELL